MAQSLLDPRFDTDACGVGFVAALDGLPSREVVDRALVALSRLGHRGAVASDGRSSDGVGILTQLPRPFFAADAAAMLFLTPGGAAYETAAFERLTAEHGFVEITWRDVPIDASLLGPKARDGLPRIRQALLTAAPTEHHSNGADELERRCSLLRKAFERICPDAYVCSLSSQTIVYKALCASGDVAAFYPDLADPAYACTFAVFHQRYATNVLPRWSLAQPFRLLAHNGEINTIWGNRARMEARRASLPSAFEPLLTPGLSDSGSLDEVTELLARHGRTICESLRILMPPVADRHESLFHRYHADVVEAWDGPAAVAFADGRYVGASLDRNGLRPCRYTIDDRLIVAGSEVGIADFDAERVVHAGRLGPGEMIAFDVRRARVLFDRDLAALFDAGTPYSELIEDEHLEPVEAPALSPEKLVELQHRFNYSREDVKMILEPMAADAKEPLWSMGDDAALAPLGRTPRPIYNYFRQRFSQVTNPPIDPLRESLVFSLRTRLGPWPHLLDKHAPLPGLALETPVLSLGQIEALHGVDRIACVLEGDETLEAALERVCGEAVHLVRRTDAKLLLLSDRMSAPQRPAIPMALALGAVHRALVEWGVRTRTGLAVEAGDCRDVHHVAVLIGYGAGAVCPWLALETVRAVAGAEGEARAIHALNLGITKIMSKCGISVLDSYRGAQLFDIIGLHEEIAERCFGQPSPLSGRTFAQIEELVRETWSHGEGELPDYGWIRFRRDDHAEIHSWQPPTIRALQSATGVARGTAVTDFPSAWSAYTRSVEDRGVHELRDLMTLRPSGAPLPAGEVEPVDAIARRFVASAMSLGSLSPEAHRTIAEAMNELGARSNTGEGGEDAPYANKIKQVASARFGVTAAYLARAHEIEIKIAQGAKPGEGGQIPGPKVTELIARLRHAQPGVTLISPPPHHDIYSIEDLAQLIWDLKCVNPRAAVGVKLVSELGVGTVAAGVAKAYADFITIAGYAGGTGASPLSSIKYAGNPWELGLAEAQQVLMHHHLRGRVRLRTDGGIANARDVVVAALLGADEYAFGTAILVSLGCDMARQCHLNTCPAGIATQKPELRAKFRGKTEHVVRFLTNLAQDVRVLLASLGLRSLDEAIGRVDLLDQVRDDGGLDLRAMLARTGDGPIRHEGGRNDRPVDRVPIDLAWIEPALAAAKSGEPLRRRERIGNADRTLGARLAGRLALEEFPVTPDLRFALHGTAGQSFGAFATEGMVLELDGCANDYVGKGLCGGAIVLRATGAVGRGDRAQVIMGNVALYGATAGTLYAAGTAGERFAVRNSGATAVVEGVGQHGCEYMTGGTVLVLGPAGRNFGAGMTGGVAYVYDPDGTFTREQRYNAESVTCDPLGAGDASFVRELLAAHVNATRSPRSKKLLDDWDETSSHIVTIRSH
ncbi:MAG TPA: glutamate synthase large subunit [Candidatus Acidoferrales bacterium]|nr:glutamate synthase large subunit [Candidatus Acidoferrales bacterium]